MDQTLLWRIEHGQFGIAHDADEQVVEVMGDTAGQHADRLQLLNLGHLSMHLFANHGIVNPLFFIGFDQILECSNSTTDKQVNDAGWNEHRGRIRCRSMR